VFRQANRFPLHDEVLTLVAGAWNAKRSEGFWWLESRRRTAG
jgi:hypothetical protein